MSSSDAKSGRSLKEEQAKKREVGKPPKPRSRESMGEPHRKTQKAILKPSSAQKASPKKPSFLAKAALAAGITAATMLGGPGQAEAARATLASSPGEIQLIHRGLEPEIAIMRKPPEPLMCEPGDDIPQIIRRMGNQEMKGYVVTGRPGAYRVPTGNGKILNLESGNAGKTLSIRAVSDSREAEQGPTVVFGQLIIDLSDLGMVSPLIQISDGYRFVHINIADEHTESYLGLMVPKNAKNLKEETISRFFSVPATRARILQSLSKLPKIKQTTLPESRELIQLIKETQAIMEPKMPTLSASGARLKGSEPKEIGHFIDEILVAYEAGMNFMIDALEKKVSGMDGRDKREFIKKALPYMVGAILRPYMVAYNGVDTLPELDSLLSKPGLDIKELKEFAKENGLTSAYDELVLSYLENLR